MASTCPGIIIAGSAGDAGKTLLSVGLLRLWRDRGLRVAAFKKGPDFIDAAWLSRAAGVSCRNLDTFLADEAAVVGSYLRHTAGAQLALIEGNRGLHDGRDAQGTHATAALARLLGLPVILVHQPRKATRTAAAAILGCCAFDPRIHVVGVVLNGVAGERHSRVISESLAAAPLTGGVVGVIPQLDDEPLLPGRHLGLVTPEEHPDPEGVITRAAGIVKRYVDVDQILRFILRSSSDPGHPGESRGPLFNSWVSAFAGRTSHATSDTATSAPATESGLVGEGAVNGRPAGCGGSVSEKAALIPPQGVGHQMSSWVRLGYFWDSAFTFYYPENLEALADAGAELIAISALADRALPVGLNGLYIGGGFPETHAAKLSGNRPLREAVRRAAAAGMPIYAECGGLVYLAESLTIGDAEYQMAGVFPVKVRLEKRPQGHGYTELMVDRENPFFPTGAALRGHEFHYTHITSEAGIVDTACAVHTGTGCFPGRDGLIAERTMAAYFHLHAPGNPLWAPRFVRAARDYRSEQESLPGKVEYACSAGAQG